MKKQKSLFYVSYSNDIVNILKRFSIAFDQAQNLKLLLGCTTKTMYLFIFSAKDLRDDLELLKSKSHDILGEKILHKK